VGEIRVDYEGYRANVRSRWLTRPLWCCKFSISKWPQGTNHRGDLGWKREVKSSRHRKDLRKRKKKGHRGKEGGTKNMEPKESVERSVKDYEGGEERKRVGRKRVCSGFETRLAG